MRIGGRRAALAALLALAAATVHAAPVQKVAVVSVFGDVLHVVTYQPVTGSHVDRNDKRAFPVADRAFDTYATSAGTALIAKSAPGITAMQVAPEATAGVAAETPAKDTRVSFPEPLAKAFADNGVSHVLLLTRARGAASLQLANGTIGAGTLEGIGFYIDTWFRTKRTDNGETGTGFLAPYAYIDGTLIDVASGTIERSARSTEGTVISAARGTTASLNPWDTLDPKQKVAALQREIRRALETIVPALLPAP